MQANILGILTFIFIFGVLVVIHEYGHLYFAKRAGILVREFSIGMGPKIFSHIAKDGTAYTIRILPVGGYVRMAGWGEDTTVIKTGQPASLTLNESGLVTRVNLSGKQLDNQSLPINVTSFDFEDRLEISGLVLDESRTYTLDHDATIVEEDGTEIRIAPLDVQYQNASVLGRLMTNFAGPLNNFILGTLAFILLVFVLGGVSDESTNVIRVNQGGAVAQAGIKSGDAITDIDGQAIEDWADLTAAVSQATQENNPELMVTYEREGKSQTVKVTPEKIKGTYYIGVSPSMKTGFFDKVLGGLEMAWESLFTILNALKNLLLRPSLDQVGGPVAIFQVSRDAAQQGPEQVIYILAALSMNVGIVNLIPIPVLDGGKIMINLLELIRRKPLKKEVEGAMTIVGVVIMVALMLVVTWNDIMRAFF